VSRWRPGGLAASVILAILGVAGACEAAHAEGFGRVEIGASAPDFTAPGADGQMHHLADYAGKVVVLEWTSPVCPFTAAKYKSGAMQALQRYAAAHHMIWLSIDTAAANRLGYLTASAARSRVAKTHAKITAFLFDPDGHIGRLYGARVTPSFFIVDRDGRLVYQGDMDDASLGEPGSGRRFVRSALEALAAGQSVGESETEPHGCAIEY
jgi:peroxiredoxin